MNIARPMKPNLWEDKVPAMVIGPMPPGTGVMAPATQCSVISTMSNAALQNLDTSCGTRIRCIVA